MVLMSTISAKRTGTTTPSEAPVRESQCNGALEQAVRRWQRQLETPESHCETNTNGNFQWPIL